MGILAVVPCARTVTGPLGGPSLGAWDNRQSISLLRRAVLVRIESRQPIYRSCVRCRVRETIGKWLLEVVIWPTMRMVERRAPKELRQRWLCESLTPYADLHRCWPEAYWQVYDRLNEYYGLQGP